VTRTLLNLLSFIVMAGGMAIAVIWTLMIAGRSDGSFRGGVMELMPGLVIALVTLAAGGVLRMLVSIDARLETLNGRA
jgi:hypothetical protein